LKRKEVSVYDYLIQAEADEFIRLLWESRISAIRQSIANGEGADYYQVLVDQSDEEKALAVAENFRNQLKRKRESTMHICTRCKYTSSSVLDRSTFSWWRKLLTRGLTVIKCNRCGFVWYT